MMFVTDPKRRQLLLGGCALAMLPCAYANYPERAVRAIIPNSPGSSVDTIGRVVMAEIGKLMGQPVVMDNRAGAAGAIGVDLTRQANADGHTVLIGSSSAISVAPLLQKAVSYQPLRDFELISLIALLPNVLVCHPSLPVETVAQFLTLAKAKAGDMRMASAGIGSASHLAGEALQAAGNFKSLHVPYRGGSQGVASVVAGETDWVLTPAPAAMSLVAGKRLKLLGHSMAANTHPIGNAPAIGLDLTDFEFSGWIGLMGPRGLSPAVVLSLNRHLARALQSESVRKAFDANGAVTYPSTPEAFRAYLTRDIASIRAAIQAAGLQAE